MKKTKKKAMSKKKNRNAKVITKIITYSYS